MGARPLACFDSSRRGEELAESELAESGVYNSNSKQRDHVDYRTNRKPWCRHLCRRPREPPDCRQRHTDLAPARQLGNQWCHRVSTCAHRRGICRCRHHPEEQWQVVLSLPSVEGALPSEQLPAPASGTREGEGQQLPRLPLDTDDVDVEVGSMLDDAGGGEAEEDRD